LENIWRKELPQIEIKSVSASYEKLKVLDNLSIELNKGEIVSLIGPSGSGKSRLLKLLVGLLKPTSGEVIIEDKKINFGSKEDLIFARSKVAIVFQQYNLFQNMDVLKNVCIAPTKIQKRDKDEVESQAIALLEKVGLKDKLKAYPGELSGGQQQRVALARALNLNPQILLLDEVTSALDPELVNEVLNSIKLLADEGMTMFIVSHEMGFVKEISNRVAFLDKGSVVEINKPDQLFNNPQNSRTKDFMSKIIKE